MKSQKMLVMVALSMFTILASSCSVFNVSNGKKGSGNIISREFAIEDYQTIDLKGEKTLYYEQRDELAPYLRIETDNDIMDNVLPVVKKGKLSFKNSGSKVPSEFKIYTNSQSLVKVDFSGSGDISLKGLIKARKLEMKLSGGGHLVIDDLQTRDFKLTISGASNAEIKGVSVNSDLKISGTGIINASELVVENTKAEISGAGSMVVNTTQSLKAKVGGSGDIEYVGVPKNLSHKISGVGTVQPFVEKEESETESR